MRTYFDPKMTITLFDAENVVTDPSGLKHAASEQFFDQQTSVAGTVAANARVVSANILNFAE